jgi:hypothetical protein
MIDVQAEFVREAAEKVCRDIDSHVLAGVFIQSGWTEVVVDAWKHGSSSAINHWCDSNIGHYLKVGNRWIIKSPEDAMLFSLKWL